MSNSQFIKDTVKKYGPTAAYVPEDAPDMEVVSTGSVSLDFATGVMGVPRGRVVELFGPESVGKSALAYYMIAEEQKFGRRALFVNLEGNFDPRWANRISGLDGRDGTGHECLVVDVENGLQAVELIGSAVHSGEFGLVVLDSIGAMLGEKESQPGSPKQAFGQSGLVTHLAKLVTVPAARSLTTVLLINQLRDDASNPKNAFATKTPGGRAVKHQAAIRINLKRTPDKYYQLINGDKIEVGFRVAAKIVKNKAAPDGNVAYWTFWKRPSEFGVLGIDRTQEVIDLATNYGVIKGSGYYTHPVFPLDDKGENKIRGKDSVSEFLLRDPEALDAIRMELMQKSRELVSEEQLVEV